LVFLNILIGFIGFFSQFGFFGYLFSSLIDFSVFLLTPRPDSYWLVQWSQEEGFGHKIELFGYENLVHGFGFHLMNSFRFG
jgi:hypothetical protein